MFDNKCFLTSKTRKLLSRNENNEIQTQASFLHEAAPA